MASTAAKGRVETRRATTKRVRIRRYRESDHDQAWCLHNLALEGTGAHLGEGPWDEDLHHIRQMYLDSGGELVVGAEAGRVVAMGALKRLSASRAEVKRMRVHPALQRRGLGQAILTYLEARAADLGYMVVQLKTTIQQTAARGLYTKNGYGEVGRKEIEGFEVIMYEKDLTGR